MKNHILIICFLFFGITSAQVQIGQTIAEAVPDDGTGTSVAIDDTGNRVIVGAQFTTIGGVNSAGETKVYELTNGVWEQIGQTLTGNTTNQRFGKGVEISSNGNRIAITGRDIVQVYDLVANIWEQVGANITAPNMPSFDALRFSGNGAILATEYFENTTLDVFAQVYRLEAGNWVEMGEKIQASEKIGLSYSGERLLLDYGIVLRVFDFVNGDWEQVGGDIEADNGDFFSVGFDISDNGNRIVVAQNLSGDDGIIFTFEYDGSEWIETIPALEVQLSNDFGTSLRLSANGNQFVFGTADDLPLNDYTYVGFYELQGSQWQQLGDLWEGSSHDETANGHTDITADGTKIIYGGLGIPGGHVGFAAVYDYSSLLSTNDANLKDAISLFPNPTSGNFTIDLGKNYSEINTTITNMLGQVIASGKFENTNMLNLTVDAATGIYFVNISTSEGLSETIRIIKN